MNNTKTHQTFLLGFIAITAAAMGQSTLTLGTAAGIAGGSVTLPVTLSAGGSSPSAIQWSFAYSTDITGVTVTIGGPAAAAQKSISCSGSTCMVWGDNNSVIADGTVAMATFQLASNPSALRIPIQLTSVVLVNAGGTANSSSAVAGAISMPALLPPLPGLTGLVCWPAAISAQAATSCAITLSAVSPLGGIAFPVASNNANLTVPSGVTVPAGQISASFTASALAVSVSQIATVTAGLGSGSRAATLNLAALSQSSAVFTLLDAVTQGNWKGHYGQDGEIVANDSNLPPTYATVAFKSSAQFTWAFTQDPRALQPAISKSNHIASTFYGAPDFSVDVNLTDGSTHQVAMYFLDWDGGGRVETVSVLDAVTLNVLDSRTVSNFAGGQYLIWKLKGHVLVTISRASGANAVVAGVFFRTLATGLPPTVSMTAPAAGAVGGALSLQAMALSGVGISTVQFQLNGSNVGLPQTGAGPAYSQQWDTTGAASGTYSLTAVATDVQAQQVTSAAVSVTVNNPVKPNAVTFSGVDFSTQGNWNGTYGQAGEFIANDLNNLPAYASLNFAGALPFTWAMTQDRRAPQESTSSANRIASTFYGAPNFTLDLNLTDGAPHQVALYFLDWDNGGRSQTVTILDAVTSQVLDTRTISNFATGQYLVWNLKGHFVIQFSRTGGANAVVNGVFVAPGV